MMNGNTCLFHDDVTVFFLILKPSVLCHPTPAAPDSFLPLSPLQDTAVLWLQNLARGLINGEDNEVSLLSSPLSFTKRFAPLISSISPSTGEAGITSIEEMRLRQLNCPRSLSCKVI